MRKYYGGQRQRYTSAKTCVNQIPAAFKKIDWEEGTVNVDIGGGKYDSGTKYLLLHDVKNLVYDPFNRSENHNLAVLGFALQHAVDTVTLCNVLNVIKEPKWRLHALDNARAFLRDGGTVYISVYRGQGTRGRKTCNGWQNNRPLQSYLPEVRKVFPQASIKNGMIVATK